MIIGFLRSIGSEILAVLAAVLLTMVFYEGVPLARSIPMIGHLPLIGWVIQGEVSRRLEGYTELSELAATKARAAKEEHDRLAVQLALEEERKRHAASEQLKDKAHAELEKRIADDAAASKADAGNGGCDDGWDAADDEWVRHH